MKVTEPSSVLPALPPGAKLLILRLRSLGDLVLETPVIAAIHAWRPDLKISVLIEPRFAAIFECNPAVSSTIENKSLFESARELRRRQFPIVFNQHGGPRSALLTGFSGAPLRVCWKGFQYSFLHNVLVPDASEFYGRATVHAVEHRISQFYWAGLPRGPIPRAQVFPQIEAVESVARILLQGGIQRGAPYAVLQPGARLPAMRWPVERFAEVARWLREERGIACVVNLSSADGEIAAGVRQAMPRYVAIPEPLSIRELIALISQARILIGDDSGPVHLAAATGRPAVVIYGPTNPVQWHPWQTEYRALHTDATFEPKRGDKSMAVRESRSIRSIGVAEVLNACAELLAG